MSLETVTYIWTINCNIVSRDFVNTGILSIFPQVLVKQDAVQPKLHTVC